MDSTIPIPIEIFVDALHSAPQEPMESLVHCEFQSSTLSVKVHDLGILWQ